MAVTTSTSDVANTRYSIVQRAVVRNSRLNKLRSSATDDIEPDGYLIELGSFRFSDPSRFRNPNTKLLLL